MGKRVFVVCCNDFPEVAFTSREAAEEYLAAQRLETKSTVPRWHWHMHEIALDPVILEGDES
jgi:hypothetical protein